MNRSMPPGKIIPELVYPDLDAAVAWLVKAFGFKEKLRIGNHRAQLVLGDESLIAIGNPDIPQVAQVADHSIMVHVDDADQIYSQATRVGAQVLSTPTDYMFGERQFTVRDIGGHRWTFTQTIADVDPSEWGATGQV